MLTQIHLSAEALRHNYGLFCQLAGKSRVAPVLKSNAYGHGLKEVYSVLAAERPEWLCVNYVAEGRLLRALGHQGRILVVGPAVVRELDEAFSLDLDLVIGNEDVLAAWMQAVGRPRLHLKFDTGMSRQGFAPSDAHNLAMRLTQFKDRLIGVCTHFANVEDVTDHGYATRQLDLFNQAVAVFKGAGLQLMLHAASSASTLIMNQSYFDLVRVGISLYGPWPSPLTRVSYLQLNRDVLDLRPVLRWTTEVTTVKPVAAGQFIGYGCTFRAMRDMRVAVLPVGYYEGYPRLAGEAASYVLIKGSRCPIVGRICMNMMMVDVTHLADCQVGDSVTLIGDDGQDRVIAHDVAGWARTIHYELLTRLHGDIPRQLD
ncbi:MAG: alanine racemase [Deltaproteobacteria bacterium]|nr:alanine racemase [Deltaproteobacteria bacterium]